MRDGLLSKCQKGQQNGEKDFKNAAKSLFTTFKEHIAAAVIRTMNNDGARMVPVDAPTTFIKPRWKSLVHAGEGLDRRFYEICALTGLKNALRSGDIWVQGSR